MAVNTTPEPPAGPAGVPCPRHDCPGQGRGTIMATGFCDTCSRRPPEAAPPPAAPVTPVVPAVRPGIATRRDTGSVTHPGAGAPAPDTAPDTAPDLAPAPHRAETSFRRAPTRPGALDRDGLVLLPDVPEPPLTDVIQLTARTPVGGRHCGVNGCTHPIGVSHDGSPPPEEGYCTGCGSRYSFRPQLRPGDEIGEANERYRVLGYLSPGGGGWVYLAEDTALQDLRVVLKAQINSSDAVARRRAVEERLSMLKMHHRDIVGIISSRRHQGPEEAEPTDYIVMEYIGGRPLNRLLAATDAELAEMFGEPFAVDHVLTYGCKILGALEYLHDQGLLYCDMKPENVIHYGRQIKVIDLGAVRRIDDRDTALVFTPRYAPPRREREERGFHVDSDLYTVARTLEALAARAAPPTGLAARSFERLIGRATHADPAARFTSAPQMSRQLWEVLREHRALTRHERYPERSTRFEPTAVLFGTALGTIPTAEHWTGRTGAGPPSLETGAPDPAGVARALPVPIPDPGDPAVVFLGRLVAGVPERVAERVEREPELRIVEVALWLCRAYLWRGDPMSQARATGWLDEAARLMGEDTAGYDWRLAWHRGLQHLMGHQIALAQGEFAAVYATVPGEWAPKLALGYCAEARGGPERETAEFYEAVWERDAAQGSAAFGLARLHLRAGRRDPAVRVLDQVPSTSRHYDAARIAAIRVLTGWLPGDAPPLKGLRAAEERVAELRPGEARDRLAAEIRENVLARFPGAVTDGEPGAGGVLARLVPPFTRRRRRRPSSDAERAADFPALPAGELFDGADSRRRLARLVFEALRALADHAVDAAERGELLDRAYAVRPESRF